MLDDLFGEGSISSGRHILQNHRDHLYEDPSEAVYQRTVEARGAREVDQVNLIGIEAKLAGQQA